MAGVIKNRHYRQCAISGWQARIAAEIAGNVPKQVPLHSHHATRQSYFAKGWNAPTPSDIAKAKYKQKNL